MVVEAISLNDGMEPAIILRASTWLTRIRGSAAPVNEQLSLSELRRGVHRVHSACFPIEHFKSTDSIRRNSGLFLAARSHIAGKNHKGACSRIRDHALEIGSIVAASTGSCVAPVTEPE